MAQKDIINLLKKKPNKWWTIKEIAKALKLGYTATRKNLQNMKRFGEVCIMALDTSILKTQFQYKYKNGTGRRNKNISIR